MTATVEEAGTTGVSALHPDIFETHILTRLDGPSLASASCASAAVNDVSAREYLWSNICHSTWPSTSAPRVSDILSNFPDGGPRSFFSQSFPLPCSSTTLPNSNCPLLPSTTELISAVDIYYRNELIFTKVEETETVTGWFRCSPFRIDLLDPKDVVPTQIQHPNGDESCTAMMDDIRLSWILIDPSARRAVNLSSHKPVSVQRHWLSGEIQVRFASILASSWACVQCGIVVNCGGTEGGETQVREVSLEVEDMDGKHLNGRDSLVILQRAMEGKRGSGVNREEEARRRYKEFLMMRKEKRERKLRIEGTLDTLCVAFGVTIFAACWFFVFC